MGSLLFIIAPRPVVKMADILGDPSHILAQLLSFGLGEGKDAETIGSNYGKRRGRGGGRRL